MFARLPYQSERIVPALLTVTASGFVLIPVLLSTTDRMFAQRLARPITAICATPTFSYD